MFPCQRSFEMRDIDQATDDQKMVNKRERKKMKRSYRSHRDKQTEDFGAFRGNLKVRKIFVAINIQW